MSSLTEDVRQELDSLDQEAEKIEDLYTSFFNRIETIPPGSWAQRTWDSPSGEIEELQRKALRKYEIWYNSATPLVEEYISSRSMDFEQHYRDFKERLELNKMARSDTKKVLNAQNADFDSQRSILRSIPSKVQMEELRIRKQITQNVAQSEIEKARTLLGDNQIRASGVIAGISLERYLMMKCENTSETIEYKQKDGISALAQKLYEADEIDQTTEKHLQHLAGIRANCAHANNEEPSENDVRRLIEDAEDYIRGRKF